MRRTGRRLGRRADALVLLDDGTVRTWRRLYQEDGTGGLAGFSSGGGARRQSLEQQERLKAWVTEVLPRTARMLDVETVNAVSTVDRLHLQAIRLLEEIEALFPEKRKIHVFVGNAKHHKAIMVRGWLARPGCRIGLHFIPAYCPHPDPILKVQVQICAVQIQLLPDCPVS